MTKFRLRSLFLWSLLIANGTCLMLGNKAISNEIALRAFGALSEFLSREQQVTAQVALAFQSRLVSNTDAQSHERLRATLFAHFITNPALASVAVYFENGDVIGYQRTSPSQSVFLETSNNTRNNTSTNNACEGDCLFRFAFDPRNGKPHVPQQIIDIVASPTHQSQWFDTAITNGSAWLGPLLLTSPPAANLAMLFAQRLSTPTNISNNNNNDVVGVCAAVMMLSRLDDDLANLLGNSNVNINNNNINNNNNNKNNQDQDEGVVVYVTEQDQHDNVILIASSLADAKQMLSTPPPTPPTPLHPSNQVLLPPPPPRQSTSSVSLSQPDNLAIMLSNNSANVVVRDTASFLRSLPPHRCAQELCVHQQQLIQSTGFTDSHTGIAWSIVVVQPASLASPHDCIDQSSPTYTIVCVVAGLSLVGSSLLLVWVVWFRKLKLWKVAQPSGLIVIVVCNMMCEACVLVLVGRPSVRGGSELCVWRQWLLCLSITCTCAALLAKVLRVYVLSTSRAAVALVNATRQLSSTVGDAKPQAGGPPTSNLPRRNSRTINPTPRSLSARKGSGADALSVREAAASIANLKSRGVSLLILRIFRSHLAIIGVVFFVAIGQVMILAVWSAVDPVKLRYNTQTVTDTQFVEEVCSANGPWGVSACGAYICVLLVWGFYLSYLTRNFSEMFAESRTLRLLQYHGAIISVVVVLVVSIPLVSDTKSMILSVICALLWFSITSQFALFAPRIYRQITLGDMTEDELKDLVRRHIATERLTRFQLTPDLAFGTKGSISSTGTVSTTTTNTNTNAITNISPSMLVFARNSLTSMNNQINQPRVLYATTPSPPPAVTRKVSKADTMSDMEAIAEHQAEQQQQQGVQQDCLLTPTRSPAMNLSHSPAGNRYLDPSIARNFSVTRSPRSTPTTTSFVI